MSHVRVESVITRHPITECFRKLAYFSYIQMGVKHYGAPLFIWLRTSSSVLLTENRIQQISWHLLDFIFLALMV